MRIEAQSHSFFSFTPLGVLLNEKSGRFYYLPKLVIVDFLGCQTG